MATPEEVAAAMAAAAAQGPRLFGLAVVKTAADVERDAKSRAPYDTGNLISSIRSEPTGAMSAVVYTTAKYGAMVEYGTSCTPSVVSMVWSGDSVLPCTFAPTSGGLKSQDRAT